jgi:Arm DNA-binding domain
MRQFNFTESRIAALTPPIAGEEVYADIGRESVNGLRIRVLASGSKTFFVRYRTAGRGSPYRRPKIGEAEETSVTEARKLASAILSAVRNGHDPAGEKKAARAAPGAGQATTLGALVDAHEADQEARGIVSAEAAAAMLRRDLVAQLGAERDPATITRAEVIRRMEALRDGSPGHAKPRPGSVATFKARVHGLFEAAIARGLVAANPLAGHRKPRASRAERIAQAERRSGRMLTMEEIAALWAACGDSRVRPAFGAYVRALIVLGCRRGEMAAARLSWIKPATGRRPALLTAPASATKAGREHVMPLAPLAVSVIASVKRYADTDLVFPGARSRNTGKTARISGWSKSWPALLKVAREYGLNGDLRIHDLRKTARSHWPRLNIHDRVGEALLNHAPADILIATYDRRDLLDEKIAAMDLWCGEIEAALAAGLKTEKSPAKSSSVVALRPAAKSRRRAPATAATA